MAAEDWAIEIEPPLHPGTVLRDEYLVPLNLSPAQAARLCGLGPDEIEGLTRGELGVSEAAARRLGRFLGTPPDFWLDLQSRFERESAAARYFAPISASTSVGSRS